MAGGKGGHSKASVTVMTAAQRREECVRLRVLGYTYKAIAEKLGVTKQTAHRHVLKGLENIREKTAEKAVELRTIEHRRLERLYYVAMERVEKPSTSEEDRRQWLESARKLSESLRKLWGLDELPAFEGPERDHTTIINVVVDGETEELVNTGLNGSGPNGRADA